MTLQNKGHTSPYICQYVWNTHAHHAQIWSYDKKNLKAISHFPMHRFSRNKIMVVKHTLILCKSGFLFWFFHQTKFIVPFTLAMPKIHYAGIQWRIEKVLGTIYDTDHYDIRLDWLYLLLCPKWPRTPRTYLVIRRKKCEPMYHFPTHTTHRFCRDQIKVSRIMYTDTAQNWFPLLILPEILKILSHSLLLCLKYQCTL